MLAIGLAATYDESMTGPILNLELLLNSRRNRQNLFRRIYCAWLIAQFFYLYYGDYTLVAQELTAPQFVGSYLEVFVGQQFFLLLLVTPAFVAGAVTDEKSRGTLQYLLTTDLTSWEIIAGKMLGRLAELGLLLLAGLPLLCFVAPFGGLNPGSILVLMGVLVGPLFALAAASMLASVWVRSTRDAALAVYGMVLGGYLFVVAVQHGMLFCMAAPPGSTLRSLYPCLHWLVDELNYFNPVYILEPIWWEENHAFELAYRCLESTFLWGALGSSCLGLAVWRLRPAYLRQLENEGKRKWAFRWLPRARVADEPIRWKERHVEGLAPLALLRRLPRWLGIAAIAAGTLFFLTSGVFSAGTEFARLAIYVFLISGLVVGIRCSGAVTGERERQTWEALLLTPLAVRELIHGKLWGILGASYPYLLAYAVPAIVVGTLYDPSELWWTVPGLLATGLGMYFAGAAGMWCSARYTNSWRSLVGTLAISSGIGVVVLLASFLAVGFAACAVLVLLNLVLYLFHAYAAIDLGAASLNDLLLKLLMGVLAIILPVWAFGKIGKHFVIKAQQYVSERERTPYWRSGVNCSFWVEEYLNRWENKRA